MTDSDLETEPTPAPLPFGVAEILTVVAGAGRVLDVGCGSGRLTVALAAAGAEVTGIDTNARQLAEARRQALEAGVVLTLREADFNTTLPFADGSFDAVTSRLALMAAGDAVATLTELRRVLVPGGRLATVLWAAPSENPWFGLPREAIGAALGPERATFARAFGKLGDPEEAAAAHRAAGLNDVEAVRLHDLRTAPDAATYWRELSAENGHFRKVDAAMSERERAALEAELGVRLEAYREGTALSLPRTQVLVTARGADPHR